MDLLHVIVMPATIALLFLLSLVSNVLIILIYVKRKRHTRWVLNKFTAHMSIANCLLSCMICSLTLLNVFRPACFSFLVVRTMANTAVVVFSASCLFSFLLVSADRFIAIVFALNYYSIMTARNFVYIVLAFWSLLSVLGVVLILQLLNSSHSCEFLNMACFSFTSRLAIILLLFVVPFLCICMFYVKIYCCACVCSQKQRESYGYDSQNTSSASLVSGQSNSKLMLFWRARMLEKPFYVRHREEFRTVKFSLSIITVSFICWTPFTMYILFYPDHTLLGEFCAILLLTYCSLTPYMHTLRSRRVRKQLANIFQVAGTSSNSKLDAQSTLKRVYSLPARTTISKRLEDGIGMGERCTSVPALFGVKNYSINILSSFMATFESGENKNTTVLLAVTKR